jgi:hypothetical protein
MRLCGCVRSWRTTNDVDFELEMTGRVVRRVGEESLGNVRLANGKEIEVFSVHRDVYTHTAYLKDVSGSVVGSVRVNPLPLRMLGWSKIVPQRPLASVLDGEGNLKMPFGECVEHAVLLAARV